MRVLAVSPILNVSDIAETIAVRWMDRRVRAAGRSGGPELAGLVRERHLRRSRDLPLPGRQGGRGKGSNTATFGADRNETSDKGVWMSIFVDDLDAVHGRCVNADLEITYPPTKEPWGVREMHAAPSRRARL